MDAPSLIAILAIIAIIVVVISNSNAKKKEKERVALMTPDEKEKYDQEKQRQLEQQQRLAVEAHRRSQEAQTRSREATASNLYGPINLVMVCPHCQTKGRVRTKHITQKKGVSGSKAAAAVVTGGLSVLAVGLARKEGATQAHCDNCNSTWLF